MHKVLWIIYLFDFTCGKIPSTTKVTTTKPKANKSLTTVKSPVSGKNLTTIKPSTVKPKSNGTAISIKELPRGNLTHSDDNSVKAKIYGGTRISIKGRPFIVTLHYRGIGAVCGGTIVSNQWILTAKHCKRSTESEKMFFVRVGSSYHDRQGFLHCVIRMHPYSSEISLEIPVHDVLLVQVRPLIRFGSNVHAARLPQPHHPLPSKLWVSGWGRTEKGMPIRLRTVSVDAVSTADCLRSTTDYYRYFHDVIHLCFGNPKKDACQGDSGGPLSDGNTIYGVVSFGAGCGVHPGVYMNVSFYRSWIYRTITYKPRYFSKFWSFKF